MKIAIRIRASTLSPPLFIFGFAAFATGTAFRSLLAYQPALPPEPSANVKKIAIRIRASICHLVWFGFVAWLAAARASTRGLQSSRRAICESREFCGHNCLCLRYLLARRFAMAWRDARGESVGIILLFRTRVVSDCIYIAYLCSQTLTPPVRTACLWDHP